METKDFYKCFISSPGNCKDERDLCDKVILETNNGLASHLNVNFNSFRWENDVLPDMGKNGQEIIDEAVEKSNYDIFIGIMRYRFGTPTKLAGSGTEHEFFKALEAKAKNPNIKIIFFFCNEAIDPGTLDFEQYKKVQDFKTKLTEQGLYSQYNSLDDFKVLLSKKMEQFAKEVTSVSLPPVIIPSENIELVKLQKEFKDALKSFNEDAPVWIEPIISKVKTISTNPSKNIENKVELISLINNPTDIIIKAPSEFGLTCLAHYLKLEAFKIGKNFIYLDVQTTRKHKIINDLQNIITGKKLNLSDVGCIILDTLEFQENGHLKLLKSVSDHYIGIPILVLNRVQTTLSLTADGQDEEVKIDRDFKQYFLLSLPQGEIRKIIKEYSLIKSIEDDNDLLLNKVTKDMETLNIHRTPKNCIAILKASIKIGLQYSPINRTKLLDAILLIIFDEFEILDYKSKKPDIKDCTFVLGYFCELLIKRNDYEFTEDFFKKKLREFCETKYIDLDINYLFQVLSANNIFANKSDLCYFKNSYWLFYFTSHRMNLDSDFLDFIYKEKKYIDFPEIIEFYTGIDRNKKDALQILLRDINSTLDIVQQKVQIQGNINPYKSIKWVPHLDDLIKEQKKITENVISSGLPDEVKDKYSDNHYNQIRPYNQIISSVMRDYSFLVLMRQITALSRAIRNSDFVDPDIKKETLTAILSAWNEVSKLLIVLAPILAEQGKAGFEGASFVLNEDDFTFKNIEEKTFAVLLAVPKNVVDFFKDDLFSMKLGPLICDKAQTETNPVLKHELMRFIISERPKKWNNIIDEYIVNLDKNSFFLADIDNSIQAQLDYHFNEVDDRRILSTLRFKCIAKHEFSTNNPDGGLINRARKLY